MLLLWILDLLPSILFETPLALILCDGIKGTQSLSFAYCKMHFRLTFPQSQWFNIKIFLTFSWQILLIIASVIGIIVYRLSVFLVFSATLSRHINGTQAIHKYLTPQTATSVTASLISFVVIMVLNIIYEKVAILITDFGMSLLCLRLKFWLK